MAVATTASSANCHAGGGKPAIAIAGYVAPTESAEVLVSALSEQGQRSRTIIEANDLSAAGQPGPRWDGAEPATLERVLFHLVNEYARHLGHLDIVAELANGTVGE